MKRVQKGLRINVQNRAKTIYTRNMLRLISLACLLTLARPFYYPRSLPRPLALFPRRGPSPRLPATELEETPQSAEDEDLLPSTLDIDTDPLTRNGWGSLFSPPPPPKPL